MARKANISRDEIIMACWNLLEQNYFPNIPRVADYFLKLDGRKCSNTTFLKAITEWEELYKERQDASFQDLFDVFTPSFKKFERDIGRDIQQLLEEKLHHSENDQALKKDATNGQYLSLSDFVVQQSQELESQEKTLVELTESKQDALQKCEHLTGRYQDTLSNLKVHQSKLEQQDKEIKTLNLNLSQKEVELASFELQLNLIKDERETLLDQIRSQQRQIENLSKQNNHKEIEDLTEQVKNLIKLQTENGKQKTR